MSDVSYHVAQYQTIINELRQEIENLHQKIHKSKTVSNDEDEKEGSKGKYIFNLNLYYYHTKFVKTLA